MRYVLMAIVLATTLVAFGCAGDDGAAGPAGPAGKTGNANVKIYRYGSQTSVGGILTYDFEESEQMVDSSLVLAYYTPSNEPANAWYEVNGMGSVNAYQTRSHLNQILTTPSTYRYTVRLVNPDGSGPYATDVTFTRFQIYLVPATEVIPLSIVAGANFENYEAVKEYFNVTD